MMLLVACISIGVSSMNYWNLEDLYKSKDEWLLDVDEVRFSVNKIVEFKGKLNNPSSLADSLDQYYSLRQSVSKIYAYANFVYDTNIDSGDAMEMKQIADNLYFEFNKQSSFITPEIVSIDQDRVNEFFTLEPRLNDYKHVIEDVRRAKKHTLDNKGENILAMTGGMTGGVDEMYQVLSNSDIEWPQVKLSNGTSVVLNQTEYHKLRRTENREDRKLVFDTFWNTWRKYEQTMGVALYYKVKEHVFYSKIRNYNGCLSRSLSSSNIPEEVYYTLIDQANKNLDTLHRFLKLQGKILKIKDPHYYDIYMSFSDMDEKINIDDGKNLVIKSLYPLGKKYVDVVKGGFNNRWMDVYPKDGKWTGAYSYGVYGVHPYVLMNYTDDFKSVDVLTHEFGHALHSHLSNESQKYHNSSYSIFMAEVASTLNEELLYNYMIENAKSDDEKLYYLSEQLNGIRATFFRQTMFAEFELRIHEAVESGEALSGSKMTKMYGDILKKYHGHNNGVMTIDDTYAVEWAFIPHFYYNFYVYQYATSMAASLLFSKRILDGGVKEREKYLDLLRSGGSKYAYDLLKEAGVDLASSEPYEALFKKMNEIMDQIEELVNK